MGGEIPSVIKHRPIMQMVARLGTSKVWRIKVCGGYENIWNGSWPEVGMK